MKRYRNRYTGQVIEIDSQITAGPWEELTDAAGKQAPQEKAETRTKADTQDSPEAEKILTMEELRGIARNYGINSFGKSADALRQMIREHEENLSQSGQVEGEAKSKAASEQAVKSSGAVIKARKDG